MSGTAAVGSDSVLLDTCALIWFLDGTMPPATAARVIRAGQADGIFVSPVSAWEIGLLARPRGNRVLRFLPDPKTWFQQAMASAGFRAAPFTPEIAIDASHLPGDLHQDPADRMLIATARHLNAPIVTRDRRILAYAEGGDVAALAC